MFCWSCSVLVPSYMVKGHCLLGSIDSKWLEEKRFFNWQKWHFLRYGMWVKHSASTHKTPSVHNGPRAMPMLWATVTNICIFAFAYDVDVNDGQCIKLPQTNDWYLLFSKSEWCVGVRGTLWRCTMYDVRVPLASINRIYPELRSRRIAWHQFISKWLVCACAIRLHL